MVEQRGAPPPPTKLTTSTVSPLLMTTESYTARFTMTRLCSTATCLGVEIKLGQERGDRQRAGQLERIAIERDRQDSEGTSGLAACATSENPGGHTPNGARSDRRRPVASARRWAGSAACRTSDGETLRVRVMADRKSRSKRSKVKRCCQSACAPLPSFARRAGSPASRLMANCNE